MEAIAAYAEVRGSKPAPGPFFRLQDGSALTKAWFIEAMRGTSGSGIPAKGYSSHSFRIGAATAAGAGVQDLVIQALGKQSSSAFLQYIHTSRNKLAAHLSSS